VYIHENRVFTGGRYPLKKSGLPCRQPFIPGNLLADGAVQSPEQMHGFILLQERQDSAQSLHEIIEKCWIGCRRDDFL